MAASISPRRTISACPPIPEIKATALEAVERFGVHSAGSPALVGNTRHSVALERKIADFLGMEEAVLYPDRLGGRLRRDPRARALRRPYRDRRARPYLPAGRRQRGDPQHLHASATSTSTIAAIGCRRSAPRTPRTASWS